MNPPNAPFETRTLPYCAAAIAEAAALIAAGQPVAVPTETVYGLAADATDTAAVARIYAAKGRPRFNPLIVHVLDLGEAERIALFDDDARALAAAFWPGPLTLVLPLRADSGIAALATAGLDTVALRVPAHRAMRALLQATVKPLAAPSANASGGISPTRATHVVASLGGRIALVIDDGATAAGLESTIVRGRDVLRPGPITEDALSVFPFPGEERRVGSSPGRSLNMRGMFNPALGPVAMAEAGSTALNDATPSTGPRPTPGKQVAGKVTAPGQLASHYAPNKPLRLDATDAATDEYLIGFGPAASDANLSPSADLIEAAANLFDALHRADASDLPRIAVAPIPNDGLGIAINDRLARAAHRDQVSREGREGRPRRSRRRRSEP